MIRRPPDPWAWALALVFGLVSSSAQPAWADPPVISNISPLGIQRGVETEVTITGTNLAGNPQLIAPFPAAFAVLPNSDATNFRLKIAVAPTSAVSVYTIRIKTDDGVSNPFLFAVGQLPQVAEKEDNGTFDTPQAIPCPVIVEGSAAGNDVDYFKFPGKKGQRIVIDAQCARIGSGVDPQIRLTTAARAFVASADDTPGLLTDARLTAVLPEDTDYVIELSDSKYQGGGRPVYRLVVGPVLVADEVYPLGGRRGDTVGFELRGGTLPDMRVAAATILAPPGSESFRLQVTNHNLGIAGPGDPLLELEMLSPLEVSDLPEIREPVDPSAPPVKAPAPVVFNGRIDPAGDEDRFVVSVTPGQSYRIQVSAADLGSALDGTLQVLNPAGGTLAQADDTTTPPKPTKGQQPNAPPLISPDPSLTYAVPSGVTEITLALKDLEGRGGVGFPYRITIEPVTIGFELSLNDSQVGVPKGGAAAVPVTVTRKGYNGPITLSVANPPAGLTFRPGTIPDGQTVGSMTLSAAPEANFGIVDVKIVGTGQGPGGPISITGSKTIVFAQQGTMPTNTLTINALAVAPALPRPISIEAPTEPVEVVHGFGASISLKVKRDDKAEGALAITALPASAGLAVPAANIAEKATDGAATVNVDVASPLGPVTIALSAKGKIAGKDTVVGIPEISLNVVRPASIELPAPAIEVKAGSTVELKGKLIRKGPFKDPVKITLNGLPPGLKAEPVTVAPEASDFTISVVADASAVAAMANANAVLAFQVNKKDYSTPPTVVAVKVVK
jgi:hypothetical protein